MTQIKLRRDTSANFTSKNPILGAGEPAYETDTKKLKIGDGTTAYTQLEYFSAGGGGSTNISATLPLKIVDGVISLEVDGQTIQIVDGKLHANLDELGNEVNSLTGEVTDLSSRVTAAEADILTKENKITTTGALSLQEKIQTNAVGFTVTSESAMTNNYYQRVPFPESQSSRLYIQDTSFTYPYKSYLAIPYSLGQVIRVPRCYGQLFFGSFDDNGDFIVSIGFNTFYYSTNGFGLFGGPVYRAVTGSSEYPPVMPKLNPTQMGYAGNYTYHTPPREAADSGDLYSLSDYLPENDFSCAFYQISPDTTGAIMIQAFWSITNGRCSTAVYRDTETSYQYAGHLDAMRNNIQYALWLPNEARTSYNPSKFGLYDWNVGRIPWADKNGWEAFFKGRGPNLYSLTGQSSKNYLELNLGDGLSVVDGKLTASSTTPTNMVTTDTAQTISGQKEFNKTILFLSNKDFIRAQQSADYRNGAGLSMGTNSTSTDGGAFAPQWKIYDTSGNVERTETIITTYNQSKLNSSNFNTANKLVRLDSEGKLPAVDGSNLTNLPVSGVEVCDIGMALYVDETKGLRRYLNGQIVDINSNTQAFLNRLKEITTLHPSLLCAEEEWQTAKTMSAFGQVGKFVFNYSGGEIVSVRLPRVVNVQGLFDLQNLGMTVSAGLPNMSLYTQASSNKYGSQPNVIYNINSTGGTSNNIITTDASGTNKLYIKDDNNIIGNSNTVQPEAIQYPYFIQITTGSETENNIINEIELNNPYSLFDSKYSDHELNNLSWLKSEGQWNSKAVYPTAYDELLTEYNNSASVNKTEGSITFKCTPKGYKIALADQETAIDTKYTTDGIAWYYILDTTNEKFKLPRTKFGFEGLRTSVGDDIKAGLPNITGTFCGGDTAIATGAFTSLGNNSSPVGSGSSHFKSFDFDASHSNPIYGNSTTVQPPATQMYLYFYVGETVQNANLIDAGRIGEQLATKTDMLQASGAGMPSSRYIDLTLGASGSTYTAPANGYYYLDKIADRKGQWCDIRYMTNGTIFAAIGCIAYDGPINQRFLAPVQKGQEIQIAYNLSGTTKTFRFIYAEGEV